MLKSQEMRKLAPEMDPLRIGTGWKKEDLEKPQIMVESTYGDSHPGSGHLNLLVEEVRKGVAEAGGFGARYFCTDICDGESQGTDGINYSLASREMIANMIEIHANATPFDGGVYLSSCDKGMPGNLIGLARVDIQSVIFCGQFIHAILFCSLLLRLLSFDFSLRIFLAQAGQYLDAPEPGTYSTPHTVQFLAGIAAHRFVGMICNSSTKPMNL